LQKNKFLSESQNIEYKQTWHDDYLKWVCGFANAFGGTIYIGRDDNGKVTHLEDYKNLLEIIPNKIRDLLGLVANVNLLQENGVHYIEIIVPKYSVAISLRGRYYFRSGSNKIELTGNVLNEFLLKKSGQTWDNVIEESATFDDIDEESVQNFIKDTIKSGRMFDVSDLSIPELFDKLRLTVNGKLKRAALILFATDPNKFYPNVIVKMGRFGDDDADLRFQELEEGNIIQLLRAVPEQLNYKFLTKNITFEGLLRIEKGPYPEPALREMLLNALVHRSYMGAAVQLRIYDNKLSLWNQGNLPDEITYESLKHHHISSPRNPLIADVCFRAGYIDSWGRGTLKIINTCTLFGLPEPTITALNGGILVTLFKENIKIKNFNVSDLNQRQIAAIEYLKLNDKITNSDYQKLNKVSDTTANRDINKLILLKILKKSPEKGSATFYELT
jgi:ATP-dependent DNA helicase RecG